MQGGKKLPLMQESYSVKLTACGVPARNLPDNTAYDLLMVLQQGLLVQVCGPTSKPPRGGCWTAGC